MPDNRAFSESTRNKTVGWRIGSILGWLVRGFGYRALRPVRLEFPILSGESAPPVWRQPNVDHVGSWRATAPRRPAAPSRHVCSVRCSTATRYPPNARRTEAKCTRLSVLARQAAVAVERLAASGRLPVECVAVSARQTAAYVAVGRARGDHWPDERVALPRVVVVYPRGAEPGHARPTRRRRRCLQGRPPVGRAAAAGQPAGVLMASPRTVSGRASAERGRGRSKRAYFGGGRLTGCCRDYGRPYATPSWLLRSSATDAACLRRPSVVVVEPAQHREGHDAPAGLYAARPLRLVRDPLPDPLVRSPPVEVSHPFGEHAA